MCAVVAVALGSCAGANGWQNAQPVQANRFGQLSQSGQQPSPSPGLTPSNALQVRQLFRVEAFIADSGALSTPGRQQSADLRVPGDFQGLFQIPADADSPYAGWFARVRGGLIAMFPKGEYNSGEKGNIYPVVPANTVYALGSIPMGRIGPRTADAANMPIDGRINTRLSNFVDTRLGGALSTRLTDADLALPESAFLRPTNSDGGKADGSLPTDSRAAQIPVEAEAIERVFGAGVGRSMRLAELARMAAAPQRLPRKDKAKLTDEPKPADGPKLGDDPKRGQSTASPTVLPTALPGPLPQARP